MNTEAHRRLAARPPRDGDHDIVVGVDLDSTCGDYVSALRDHLVRVEGADPASLTPAPTHYDLSEWDLDRFGGHAEVHGRAVDDGLFRRLDPLPGVVDALWHINDLATSTTGPYAGLKVRIAVVTARLYKPGQHGTVCRDTAEWLDIVGIPYSALCFEDRKERVDCHVLVDDSPTVVEQVRRHRGRDAAVVIDHPWNRHVAGPRMRDWSDWHVLIDTALRRTSQTAAAV